ncbi:Aldo/keto reductase [Dichomitus squalens]|uniref:Aldo/keto reductase n=1 Tax=Dichomitus squalens TaxID=114155 RepID=A0A4Q9NCV6_9APHY|nr:Aldo/keto reductase [Dichomitus squalens]TBU64313.1 Aldo/keto reductase [Dichomitus squalens]
MPVETLAVTSLIRLSTGYDMPRLGFGVYQNYATHDSVLEALRAGYKLVDTAQAYRNEAGVGSALRASGLPREEVFLTTKCISKTHGYEKTSHAVDVSLERLGVDYIDLFLIHDPFKGRDLRLETYRALLDAQRARKIRTVGVSNFGIKHLEELRNAGLKTPSVNQIELHPFCQQRPIVAYCHEQGIVVQAYSPLVRGQLDHAVFEQLAHKHKRDPAQILLRWSLQKGYVPLPKSAKTTRIRSNADLYNFSLDVEDIELLDGLDKGKDGAVTWNPVDAE